MTQKTHPNRTSANPLISGSARTARIVLLTLAFLALPLPNTAIAQTTLDTSPPTTTNDAQDQPPNQPTEELTPESGLESPQSTLRTFLTGMTQQQSVGSGIDQAIKSIDFPQGLLQSTKVVTANELYQFLNRLEYIDYSDHPNQASAPTDAYTVYPNTTRSLKHLAWSKKYPGARVTMTVDERGSWRFSRETAETIHALWIATEEERSIVQSDVDSPLIQDIRAQVPTTVKGTLYLGLELWQWIGILLVIFIGMLADLIVRTVLRKAWHRFEIKRNREASKEVLKRAVRPFGLLAASGIWYSALDLGLLPPTPASILLVAVRLFFMFSMVWAAFRVTDLLGDWLAGQAEKTETKYDDLLIPMIVRTAKIFIAAIGLIYTASAFSIEILPLLTGLGIGGLAFAFAAKDTIENIFGSIAVILDRPFEIGDWVVIDDVEGTVEDLGFRSTRVRTFYNSVVTVPNATLVRATVDNYGRRQYRRYRTLLNLTYDTHPDKIEAFCAGVREIVKLHPYTRKDYYHVWLSNFGPHSLDVLVYMFFECPDWSIELREKHRFMLDIVRLADRLGVEFAFPTQTLHLQRDESNPEHTPSAIPDESSERRSVLEGRKIARELTSNQPWKDELPGPVRFAEEFDSDHEARGNSE
ncbi:MAG: mechanosensitive ion channel family protein [Phycisphaerales bacterium]